jgi:2-polyprenyl-3-methyl-5-hydroxy-6-metoxy-1,4-benzoquinol methylase
MRCRHCGYELLHVFVDLFNSPPSNSYLTHEQLKEPEILYPLKVFVCDKCFLVQIDEYKKSEEIFNSEYIYFSSYSTTWLKHAETYTDMITKKLKLNKGSFVIEIACNDGYLLQYFQNKKIPCIGIEPSTATAQVAKRKGIEVLEQFFTADLAVTLRKADLVLGNNVLAHVPNINDFVKGLKTVLKPEATITMEFPHLLNLIVLNQFDTIYHEHFSYLSLLTAQTIFESQGLKIYDVEELPTHGGSLRIYAAHVENDEIQTKNSVNDLINREKVAGLNRINGYEGFERKVQQVKWDFLSFLLNIKKEGKRIAAYGAAAKGNTFLNYCGIKSDLIDFVVDASPYKQNQFLPQSHIPIVGEDMLKKYKPDYVLILPWNIKEEIGRQLNYIKAWKGRLVTAIPNLEIFKDGIHG